MDILALQNKLFTVFSNQAAAWLVSLRGHSHCEVKQISVENMQMNLSMRISATTTPTFR